MSKREGDALVKSCPKCQIMKSAGVYCDRPDCPDKPALDLVNHPPHYTSHPSGIECIAVTRHMNFNLGNAMKYIWRAGVKGAIIQDLEKAIWYLNDEIKRLRDAPKPKTE